MKLCKDCKHIKGRECFHPLNMKVDAVDGKEKPGASGYRFCTILRDKHATSKVFWCGIEAKHFEQKPAQKRPWWAFWK